MTDPILAQMVRYTFNQRENIVGKGENAVIQQFILFLCLPKAFFFLPVVKNMGLFGKGIILINKVLSWLHVNGRVQQYPKCLYSV